MKTPHEITLLLANSDPIGIVDYERDYSPQTPGAGPMKGCLYCKSDYVFTNNIYTGHQDNCVWMYAIEYKNSL